MTCRHWLDWVRLLFPAIRSILLPNQKNWMSRLSWRTLMWLLSIQVSPRVETATLGVTEMIMSFCVLIIMQPTFFFIFFFYILVCVVLFFLLFIAYENQYVVWYSSTVIWGSKALLWRKKITISQKMIYRRSHSTVRSRAIFNKSWFTIFYSTIF